MGKEEDLSDITKELHQLFVWLTKKCFTERPKDVPRFCLDMIAMKLGQRVIEEAPGLSREVSLLQKDNVTEFVNDIRLARQASLTVSAGREKTRKCGYISSDDHDEDGVDAVVIEHGHNNQHLMDQPKSDPFISDKSVTYVDDEEISEADDDDDDDDGKSHGSKKDDEHRVEFFNCDTFSSEELEEMVERYGKDERMIQLFREWDGDDSGAVDFVELVIALHKFEHVSSAGVDIKVAADALVEFVESDTERELKLPQFAKVIVVFTRNLFGKPFDDVADHMLKVAGSTSEAAMLEAARGGDVSDIVALDKEELELMRETAKCVSVNVESNISKLRTTRANR